MFRVRCRARRFVRANVACILLLLLLLLVRYVARWCPAQFSCSCTVHSFIFLIFSFPHIHFSIFLFSFTFSFFMFFFIFTLFHFFIFPDFCIFLHFSFSSFFRDFHFIIFSFFFHVLSFSFIFSFFTFFHFSFFVLLSFLSFLSFLNFVHFYNFCDFFIFSFFHGASTSKRTFSLSLKHQATCTNRSDPIVQERHKHKSTPRLHGDFIADFFGTTRAPVKVQCLSRVRKSPVSSTVARMNLNQRAQWAYLYAVRLMASTGQQQRASLSPSNKNCTTLRRSREKKRAWAFARLIAEQKRPA